MKRVWGYIRVDSNKDLKGKNSFTSQQERLNAYAQNQGFELAGISVDYSDGTDWDRPGLRMATQATIRKTASAILVTDLGRIGRNLMDAIAYAGDLTRECGASVIAADSDADTSRLPLFQSAR